MECHSVSPYTLVMESVDEFRAAALDAGIRLQAEVPTDLPDICVDQSQIRHVFDNLLSNAVRFTPAGGDIIVSARNDKNLCIHLSLRYGYGDSRLNIRIVSLTSSLLIWSGQPGKERGQGWDCTSPRRSWRPTGARLR